MNETTLRLMLIDDHAVVREGLRALLEDNNGFTIVAEADCGSDALRKVEVAVTRCHPDRPGHAGDFGRRDHPSTQAGCPTVQYYCFHQFRRRRRTAKHIASRCNRLPAQGCFTPRPDQRRACCRQGAALAAESMQRQMVEMLRRPPPADPFAALTPRERSVLALIGKGLSNRRIASELSLTEGTVKGYVSTVLEKLGVDDRTQAALYFNRHAASA